MQPTKWETQNKGVAKNAFDKAQSKTQATQQTGQSDMVRNSQLKTTGPKPPSLTRSTVDRQIHAEQLSAEDKKARAMQPKAEPKLSREEDIAQLTARMKKAREKDMGR